MPDGRLKKTLGVSLLLHVLVLLAVLIGLPTPKLEKPEDQAVSVELVTNLPAQEAQGEKPAPKPAPKADKLPTPPTPDTESMDKPRDAPPAPPPPPPPPPPAPSTPPAPPAPPQQVLPPPAPPAPAQPDLPTPPPPPPAPTPEPTPAPPPPKPQPEKPQPPQPQKQPTPPQPPKQPAAQAQTDSKPTTQPPREGPPLPTPPPPAPPPPTPSQSTAGTGTTPPVAKPQDQSRSVLNTLERLRQDLQTEAPKARANASSAARSGGGAPRGSAPLTQGEVRGLADQISECWSIPMGSTAMQSLTVEMKVVLDGDGNVRMVRPAGRMPSDPQTLALFDSAKRALLSPQCNPLKVPRDKLATIEASTFRFSPKGLLP